MEMLKGFGAAWTVVAIVGLIYWWLKRQKPQPQPEVAQPIQPIETPKYTNTVKKKMKPKEDNTKLLSLQPANRAMVPGSNWTAEEVEIDGAKTHQWKPTPPLKGDFQWKFYGSQLSVGDKLVFSGLPKKLHLLEITPQDQVYLNGTPMQIHPGELESLKRTIRDANP